jgi:hypothetical protein
VVYGEAIIKAMQRITERLTTDQREVIATTPMQTIAK